tara:strand:- start:362 stop:544 length:183 start_codon:yes stop_codon:yes gene_type:complete
MAVKIIRSNHVEAAFMVTTKEVRLHLVFLGVCWQYKSGYFAIELQLPFAFGLVAYINNFR